MNEMNDDIQKLSEEVADLLRQSKEPFEEAPATYTHMESTSRLSIEDLKRFMRGFMDRPIISYTREE